MDKTPETSRTPPLSDCCPSGTAATSIARHFDRKVTESDTDFLDLPEPAPISARLMDLLADVAKVRPSVLDVGCGTGAAAVRLLQHGSRMLTGIDLSPASIEIARKRAASACLGAERARFSVGDAASVSLQPHDWVLLDRVICCFGDADRLVSNALAAALHRFAFSVPESRGWRGALNAIGWSAENLIKTIFRRNACRGYVHDVKRIEQRLEAAGFRKLRSGHSGLWYAAVFERARSPNQ